SDDHTLNLFQPCIRIDKTGDPLSKVGDDVHYTITLTNCSSGDTPPLQCSLSDSLFGPDGSGILPLGDTIVPVTRTVQPGDPDPLVNTATLTCSPEGFPNVLEVSDDHSVNLFQPEVTVTKTGDDLSKEGDGVTYTIEVCNTGSADSPDLVMDSVIDDVIGDLSASFVLPLGPGECESHDFDYTVQAGDPDPLVNTVTVHYHPAEFPNDITDDDDHSLNLFQPCVRAGKTGDPLSKIGDDVDYTITLTNCSSDDTPALDCVADDSLLGVVFAEVLPLGDTEIDLSRTVLDTDADPLVNTVTLTCSPEGFPNVLEASDDHSVNLFQPCIRIDKTGDPLSKIGDDVDYTITLTNCSSDDTPTLVCTLVDSLLGSGSGILPLGDTVVPVTRTVQPGDPDPLVNTATLTCSPEGFPNVLEASDDHSVNLFQPSVDVEKVCDDFAKFLATVDPPDVLDDSDDIRCTITVTNTGSADSPDLENGTINDTLCGDLLGTLNAECSLVSSDCTSDLATGDSCEIVYDFLGENVTSTPDPIVNTVTVHYNPIGFPNDITDSDT
ncbi:MAG: hypothetical protein AABZ01_05575, partial [Gemmatimonadota bacterium]